MTEQTIPVEQFQRIRREMTRFLMTYQFAMDELTTKIEILQQEFHYLNDYNPIEHVASRLKTPESIIEKLHRKSLPVSLSSIRTNIQDIAGIRINCSFRQDIYEVSRMLLQQQDIALIEEKDYIRKPKESGYQSLHLIVSIPVFMSDRTERVPVELQIRTIAMDFWASLEHKIFYKYDRDVPERLRAELQEAAATAAVLDQKMERLHQEMQERRGEEEEENVVDLLLRERALQLPASLLSGEESHR
ncbi:GTP pyrophosphokinase [Alkalicoccus chagannorensis]|uniref:GTP pyrophosphokinase n=1 Tax=Alkalicoccus chagannorensis TaxID=427072 RepID=UPI0003FD10AF|nr:GTP pyrophosphokinase family protein [Alkalicoccus chagannorensis]